MCLTMNECVKAVLRFNSGRLVSTSMLRRIVFALVPVRRANAKNNTSMTMRVSATAAKMEYSSQPPPTPSLSPEEQHIIELIRQSKNVFVSGSGGTGKTFVIQLIRQEWKGRHGRPEDHNAESASEGKCGCYSCNVVVTASTGIAALPIGGSTLHKAAGIGIPRRRSDFSKMWNLWSKWRNCRVLIVDEISMLSAEYLELFEQTVCQIRSGETSSL